MVKHATHQKAQSLRVIQHGQQQLYLQYKVRWILYKVVGAPSSSQSYLCIQPSLQSPTKFCSSTPVSFHLFISPSSDHKIILTISPTLLFSTPQQLLTFQQSIPKIFSLPQPFSQFRLSQKTRKLGSLVKTDTVLER